MLKYLTQWPLVDWCLIGSSSTESNQVRVPHSCIFEVEIIASFSARVIISVAFYLITVN